jgi:predicted regulator of Ras-like GTPase activity (Roadblock/LC7/MglB family)
MEAPPAVAQGQGQQPNTIMDRLNSILGDDLTAMAAGGPGAAPVPGAPMAPPPPPAPPQMVPPPAPAAQQAPAADASQFDIPIQDRMKQQAAQPAAEPVAARSGGLFNVDDATMDKVFSNIGVNDKQPAAAVAAPANMAATPVPPAVPVGGGAVPPPVPPMQGRGPVPPVAPPAVPGAPKISAVPPRNAGGAPIPPNPPMPGAPAAPAAPAAAAPAAPAQAGSKGLFNVDDAAMDKIFSQNLGVTEGAPATSAAPAAPQAPPAVPQRPPVPPVAPMGAAPAPVPPAAPAQGGGWTPPAPPQAAAPAAPAPTAPAAAQQPGNKGLFNVDDAAMDKIFNDLGVKEKAANAAAAPKMNVREAVSQIRNLAEMPAPKVEGVGRLSRSDEPSEPAPAGKINAIGKFLLDQQDLQKLGNLAQSDLSDGKVRVLTHEASEEISKLLEHIATQAGVVGSVIVGHDGILIANSLPKELDPETIGILSLGIYVNTTSIAKKMGHSHLHQLVSKTQYGYLVIADFGGGILVTVSNGQETDKLIPLMRSITQLVAQN